MEASGVLDFDGKSPELIALNASSDEHELARTPEGVETRLWTVKIHWRFFTLVWYAEGNPGGHNAAYQGPRER